MREYILTDEERKIIQDFITTGAKPSGSAFRTLLARCRHMETINKDLDLVKRFLEKANEEKKVSNNSS